MSEVTILPTRTLIDFRNVTEEELPAEDCLENWGVFFYLFLGGIKVEVIDSAVALKYPEAEGCHKFVLDFLSYTVFVPFTFLGWLFLTLSSSHKERYEWLAMKINSTHSSAQEEVTLSSSAEVETTTLEEPSPTFDSVCASFSNKSLCDQILELLSYRRYDWLVLYLERNKENYEAVCRALARALPGEKLFPLFKNRPGLKFVLDELDRDYSENIVNMMGMTSGEDGPYFIRFSYFISLCTKGQRLILYPHIKDDLKKLSSFVIGLALNHDSEFPFMEELPDSLLEAILKESQRLVDRGPHLQYWLTLGGYFPNSRGKIANILKGQLCLKLLPEKTATLVDKLLEYPLDIGAFSRLASKTLKTLSGETKERLVGKILETTPLAITYDALRDLVEAFRACSDEEKVKFGEQIDRWVLTQEKGVEGLLKRWVDANPPLALGKKDDKQFKIEAARVAWLSLLFRSLSRIPPTCLRTRLSKASLDEVRSVLKEVKWNDPDDGSPMTGRHAFDALLYAIVIERAEAHHYLELMNTIPVEDLYGAFKCCLPKYRELFAAYYYRRLEDGDELQYKNFRQALKIVFPDGVPESVLQIMELSPNDSINERHPSVLNVCADQ